MLKLLLVVILVALAVYFATRMLQEHGSSSASRLRRPQPPRVMGPDDDPEFLRDLDRRRRHPEDPES